MRRRKMEGEVQRGLGCGARVGCTMCDNVRDELSGGGSPLAMRVHVRVQ